ncbi:hypothetical protein [Clostridium sp. SM-530-WT-3G]|uniref:hypothetical protein n=1 Tax=Clostridium sp. SM-530-WT-3G TaxID=2725303 RepID=UPI00145F4646|nr:hypothetical protein [Clostridium sp. SM-530-WT-3G]NME83293.1 hypothetical protein [Clostridium sp. SM-530-WT-3G]
MKNKLFLGKINLDTIFFIIFISGLIIMYTKPFGIPAIKECYDGFVMPDMEFGYTYEFIKDMFDNLGAEGLRHYSNYYNIDMFFIVGLIGVQFYLLRKYKSNNNFINKLCGVFIVTRCIFDVLEDLSFKLIIKGVFTLDERIVNITSGLTKMKFVSMGLWGMLFIGGIVIRKIELRRGKNQGL